MLCFVGVFVRLVIRSDVVTAHSLGYLLTKKRKKEGRRREEGLDKERKRNVSFNCDSDNQSLTHAHTHNVQHKTVSEVHIISYTGPLSKLCFLVQGL